MKVDGKEIARAMFAKRNLDSIDGEDKAVMKEQMLNEAAPMQRFMSCFHEKDAEGAHGALKEMVQGMMSKYKERKEEKEQEG